MIIFKVFLLATIIANDGNPLLPFLDVSEVSDAWNAGKMFAFEKESLVRFRKMRFTFSKAAFGHGNLLNLHLYQIINQNFIIFYIS